MQPADLDSIAAELLDLLGTGRQVGTLATRHPGFSLEDGYAVVARLRALREARGERVVGRKIGFTNTAVWDGHGIAAPIWHFMFDTSVRDLDDQPFPLRGFPEPLIEPEIVLHLARAPDHGMDEAALLGCIDWVAHGFEVVASPFPGWSFGAADAAAALGVHAGLRIGPRHAVTDDRTTWLRRLSEFRIVLARDGGEAVQGEAANVLGGPLSALRFLVEELARRSGSAALRAGEVVTTGTLTRAMPVCPGDTWRTRLDGAPFEGLCLSFR